MSQLKFAAVAAALGMLGARANIDVSDKDTFKSYLAVIDPPIEPGAVVEADGTVTQVPDQTSNTVVTVIDETGAVVVEPTVPPAQQSGTTETVVTVPADPAVVPADPASIPGSTEAGDPSPGYYYNPFNGEKMVRNADWLFDPDTGAALAPASDASA